MKFSWWKFVVTFILYLFFHEAYDLIGDNVVGRVLGEAIGGVYPHMKMLFYAYLVVSIVDYFIQRSKGTLGSSFFYSRMLILAAVPWMMIIIYYIFEALGMFFPRAIDLTWAILNTLKGMIILAFVAAFITYVGFSFQVPDNFFFAVE